MIFAVKGREKFWKIKRGRERKSLGSPGLNDLIEKTKKRMLAYKCAFPSIQVAA